MSVPVPYDPVGWEWASLLNGYLLGLIDRARAEGQAPWLVLLVETSPTSMTLEITSSTMAAPIRLTVQVHPQVEERP